MAESGPYYPDNHIDVPPQSTVNITLSMRRASRDSPEASTMSHVSAPAFESVLPIRSARPVMPNEIILPTRFSCGSMEAIENEYSGELSVPVSQESERLPLHSGPLEYTHTGATAHQPSTFAFGPPLSNESGTMSPPPVKVEAEGAAGFGDLMNVRSEGRKVRRAGYNATTMADFRQHLSVFNCSGLNFTASPNSVLERSPQPPQTQDRAHQDYQMQLMLLEQQQRKRELIAQKALGQTPGYLADAHKPTQLHYHSLQDYQMQLLLLDQQQKKRDAMVNQELDAKPCHHVQPGQTTATNKRALMATLEPEQKASNSSTTCPQQASGTENQPWQDYQLQLTMFDRQIEEPLPGLNGKRQKLQTACTKIERTPQPSAYQMQLMQLEEQNKKRLWQARLDRKSPPSAYQMQLMQLEEQNKKRLWQTRLERNTLPPDYQMQLMQLEEQNRKRLVCKAEPEINPPLSEYQQVI